MNTELVCLDMAGTTMRDDGLVLEAFRRTIADLDVVGEGAERAEAFVIETMGQSKIEVFTALFGDRAERANDLFEGHFADAARAVGVAEVDGVRDVVAWLRAQGIDVALTTGFSPSTRETLVELLGWDELFPLRVSPADAGRGRPAPDMLLVCALAAQVTAVENLVVVGDTVSDMEAGHRAGAGLCVGVLTGSDGEDRLWDGGADAVVGSVADLFSVELFDTE